MYVQGGFLCATVALFQNFINKMIKLIDTDQALDIMPKWHDESYLNKLVNMNIFPYSLLEQRLFLPEEYGVSSKIVLLDKRKKGGHYQLRFLEKD